MQRENAATVSRDGNAIAAHHDFLFGRTPFAGDVELEGEEILMTDNNKPVARISQYQNSMTTAELFKNMRGKVRYFEDLTTPTTEEWQEV